MVLNVYKPRGLTRYGWRKQQEQRQKQQQQQQSDGSNHVDELADQPP
jgi:hypothetical protein